MRGFRWSTHFDEVLTGYVNLAPRAAIFVAIVGASWELPPKTTTCMLTPEELSALTYKGVVPKRRDSRDRACILLVMTNKPVDGRLELR